MNVLEKIGYTSIKKESKVIGHYHTEDWALRRSRSHFYLNAAFRNFVKASHLGRYFQIADTIKGEFLFISNKPFTKFLTLQDCGNVHQSSTVLGRYSIYHVETLEYADYKITVFGLDKLDISNVKVHV